MFTIEAIYTVHSKVKSGADFPQYIQNLKALGVTKYDLMVEDGRGVYFGANGFQVSGPSKFEVQAIAQKSDADGLKQALVAHQQGQTSFAAFCAQAAAMGVEKWTTDIAQMNVIYYDKFGNELLKETIPIPEN